MEAVLEAIGERLRGDATLAGLLSTYGGGAAVFRTDPAPGDAVLPYIVISGPVGAGPYDTKTRHGRSERYDVRCYATRNGSVAAVNTIAERAWALLHRVPLAVAGGENWIANATGPITADDAAAYGRVLTVEYTMLMEA
jgi:hypothetical protein